MMHAMYSSPQSQGVTANCYCSEPVYHTYQACSMGETSEEPVHHTHLETEGTGTELQEPRNVFCEQRNKES
jgi:hypothetical protein